MQDTSVAPLGAVTAQNWDQGGALSHWVYLHATEVFPAVAVPRGPAVRPLPVRLRPEIAEFVLEAEGQQPVTLGAWLRDSALDGLLILHKGVVVFEEYPHMQADQRHLLFSVTKALVGTLLGLLEDRGTLDLDGSVERYLPELAVTAWAGTSVRDIADMASGMEGEETSVAAYSDPRHPHYQLEAALGWQPVTATMPAVVREGDTLGLLAALGRVRPAGEERIYASVNTALLAALLERVTGQPLAALIASELWSPMGAEQDAWLLTSATGTPIAHGGLVATLRDLARFGLLFTASGQSPLGPGVIPRRFLERLLWEGRPALLPASRPAWLHHASYQWDQISAEGELVKGGFGDQLLYVHTDRDVVIAYVGTNATLDAPPARLPLRALVAHFFS